MNDILISVIGYAASIIGVSLMLPQVLNLTKRKALWIYHGECWYYIF